MQLDLNLLTALDALLDEGSVTGAAARLHVTTPAMSRTLGRIRNATGDQILVRTGRAMVPTAHALTIRADVAALVAQSRTLLSPVRELDLARLERTFTLVAHDTALTTISGALLTAIQAQAPAVLLRLLAEAPIDTPELARGQIDLEISGSRPASGSIRSETIADYALVVAMNSRHRLTHGTLTLARYAQARHVTVSRRGRLHDPLDAALHTEGLQRTVVASLPTVAAALDVVRNSDLLVVIANPHSQPPGITTRALPLDLPATSLNMSWHQRYDDDPAHHWLRNHVRDTFLTSAPLPR
jgi:DNA-binding transcriptional LysR family regulator